MLERLANRLACCWEVAHELLDECPLEVGGSGPRLHALGSHRRVERLLGVTLPNGILATSDGSLSDERDALHHDEHENRKNTGYS